MSTRPETAPGTTSMTRILTHPSQTALWHELVREGEQRVGRELGEERENYLVMTLMRHIDDAPLPHRVMAFELLEALQRNGRQRQQDLRDVGDRCLLISGLYPELAQRRRVQLAYFMDLGRGAYARLAQEVSAALAALYGELANTFAELVRVLFALREFSGAVPALAPLDRYVLALDAHSTERDFPDSFVMQAPRRIS
jgi:hypothetical protein